MSPSVRARIAQHRWGSMLVWIRPLPMHRRSPPPKRQRRRTPWHRIVPGIRLLDARPIELQPIAAESPRSHDPPQSCVPRPAPAPRYGAHAVAAWPWLLNRLVSRCPPVEASGPLLSCPSDGTGATGGAGLISPTTRCDAKQRHGFLDVAASAIGALGLAPHGGGTHKQIELPATRLALILVYRHPGITPPSRLQVTPAPSLTLYLPGV